MRLEGGNDARLAGDADIGVSAVELQSTPLALVRGANAAPTGEDFTATTFTGVELDFVESDFGHSDDDGDPLKEIQVVTLPDSAHGELKLDGTAIPSSDLPKTVSRGDLEQGKLVFEPVLDFLGDASFTFKVVDSLGKAAASSRTATVTVTSDPDAPPSVVRVRVISTPANDTDGDGNKDTYGLGETIEVRLSFNHVVGVDATGGKPRLKIKMDPSYGEKWAEYESGSGTRRLTFTYTVVEPNESPRGIAVLQNTLQLNGGVMTSSTSELDPVLNHPGLPHDPRHRAHWLTTGALPPGSPPPSVSSVEIVSSPSYDADGSGGTDTYLEGETVRVRVRVNFDQSVWVDTAGGSPRIKLKL